MSVYSVISDVELYAAGTKEYDELLSKFTGKPVDELYGKGKIGKTEYIDCVEIADNIRTGSELTEDDGTLYYLAKGNGYDWKPIGTKEYDEILKKLTKGSADSTYSDSKGSSTGIGAGVSVGDAIKSGQLMGIVGSDGKVYMIDGNGVITDGMSGFGDKSMLYLLKTMLDTVGGTGVLLGMPISAGKSNNSDVSWVDNIQSLLGKAIAELSIAYAKTSDGNSDIGSDVAQKIDSVIEMLINARK